MKKVPERRCVVCYNSRPKSELIRIVKPKDDEISVDLTGKKSGRGCYICNSIDCLNLAVKSDKLSKVFDSKVNKIIYEELRDIIAESNK